MALTRAELLARPDFRQGFVLALEGLPYWFISRPELAAVWTERPTVSGLKVTGTVGTAIKIGEATPVKQESLSFEIIGGEVADVIFAPAAGVETISDGAIAADAVTIDAALPYGTTGFPAAPAFVYAGPETIGYTGLNASQFTGCTRGRYPPIGDDTVAADRRQWALRHYILDSDPDRFKVKLTSVPVEHFGRRCALYHVLYDPTAGAWQGRTQAHVLWVGRVTHLEYDGAGSWRLDARHLAADLERKVNDPPFRGQIARRLYLPHGDYLLDVSGHVSHSVPYTSMAVVGVATVTVDAGVTGSDDGEQVLRERIATALGSATGESWSIELLPAAGPEPDRTYWRLFVDRTLLWDDSMVRIRVPEPLATVLGLRTGEIWLRTAGGSARLQTDWFAGISDGEALHWWWGGTTPFGTTLTSGFWHPQAEAAPLANGYLLVGDGEGARVMMVDATGAPSNPSFTLLFAMEADAMWAFPEQALAIRQVWAPGEAAWAEGDPVGLLLLKILASTGAGVNWEAGATSYDVFDAAFGLGIPACLIDADSFARVLTGRRAYRFRDSVSVAELLRNEMLFAGYYPVWTGQRLEARRLPMGAAAVDAVLQLSNSNKVGRERPRARRGTEHILNAYSVETNYEVRRDRFNLKLNFDNVVSQRRFSVTKRGGTLKLYGQSYETEAELEAGLTALADLVQFWGEPLWVVETTGNQATMDLVAGDVVELAEQHVPGPAGGVGQMAKAVAVVLDTGFNLETARNGIKIITLPSRSILAPSWAVAVYVAGPPVVITIDAAEYGPLSRAAPALSFLVGGDFVRIAEHDPVDPAVPLYWDRQVVSVDAVAGTITINAALGGFVAGRPYLVIFQDYGSVAAGQKAFTFLADDATGFVSGSTVYRYT